MRIVYMGTPDFAKSSLRRLIDEKFDVIAVFTQPDRPKNRGMEVAASPVKELALECGIPVFQPESLKDGGALEILRKLEPELIAVVAYGRILPKEILDCPKYGCVNIHASLLPKYRGAAPAQWAVLNGDEVTGVTSMYMAEGLDSGDIIYSEETKIGEYETSGQLLERLRDMGANLLCRSLRDIERGIAPRVPQNHEDATLAPPLVKSMGPIDWTKEPREILKWIYGLIPWPVATAEIGGKTVRIFGARYTGTVTAKPPGEPVSAGQDGIEIACGGGKTLMVTELQAPGGKRMPAGNYIRGNRIEISNE